MARIYATDFLFLGFDVNYGDARRVRVIAAPRAMRRDLIVFDTSEFMRSFKVSFNQILIHFIFILL